MAQEIAINNYYQDTYNKGFVSTEMCCKLGMEFFFSNLLFKKDLSRVIYAKEDI